MKKLAIALLTLAAIALPQGAIAQQAIYNSPHKWTDSFGKIRVYIPGTADTVVDVVTESSKEYTFTVNTCGWISLRQSTTRKIKSFSTSTNSLSVSNFSAPDFSHVHGPLCTFTSSTGWSFWDALNSGESNINASNGRLVTITGSNQFFVKVVQAINSTVPVIQGTVTYENIIKNKINSCGFGTIIVSPTRPMTTFKIGTINYTLATLPPVTKPQICRIQSGVKMRYVPLN